MGMAEEDGVEEEETHLGKANPESAVVKLFLAVVGLEDVLLHLVHRPLGLQLCYHRFSAREGKLRKRRKKRKSEEENYLVQRPQKNKKARLSPTRARISTRLLHFNILLYSVTSQISEPNQGRWHPQP